MSLFSIKKTTDTSLDDVFAKSATYASALPTPSVASTSQPTPKSTQDSSPTTPATTHPEKKRELNEDGTVKRKRGKKERPDKAGKSLVQQEKEMGKGKKEGDVEETMQLEEIVLSANEPVEPVSPDEPITTTEPTTTSITPTPRTSDQRKNRRIKKKPKYTPPSETPADLDRRTCFIGNVSISVLKSSALQSQLKNHLLGYVPGAGIESVRFRSIAFSAPTVQKEVPGGAEESARVQREKERAERWREEEEEDEGRKRRRLDREREEEEGEDKVTKVFFRPGEKRKVAFLKGEFHKDVTTANAYIVFAHPSPDRSPNVPTLMDPYEAATQLILKANGSVFQSLHLRVDSVRPTLSAITSLATAEGKSTLPKRREIWSAGKDPKCSLFVGNLDVAAQEEDLRLFFEGLVRAERGVRKGTAAEGAAEGTAEGGAVEATEGQGEEKAEGQGDWVLGVRIVRDKESGMGKGFGFVAFADRESVDEVLALPSTKLKHAKRNLRIQPCKALPTALGGREIKPIPDASPSTKGGSKVKVNAKAKVTAADKKKSTAKKPAAVILPRVSGDPTLGAKISSLNKDERKVFKSNDPTRLARRAAKKQSAKLKLELAGKRDKVKLDVKGTSKKLAGGKEKVRGKKSRVRSEHAATKMKGKRD